MKAMRKRTAVRPPIRGDDMEFTVGQVVFSKCGRDKKYPFIIYSVEGDFLFLVDGKMRPLEKPKKKKIKHVQPVNYIDEAIKQKLENKLYLNNSDVKKALAKYAGL